MTEFLIISYITGAVIVFITGMKDHIEGVSFPQQFIVALITGLGWPIYVLIGLLVKFLTHNQYPNK